METVQNISILDGILEMLGHEHFLKILKTAMQKPVNAHEIYETTKIPLSSIYNGIEFLLSKNLVKIAVYDDDSPRKTMKISANLTSFVLVFDGDTIELNASKGKFKESKKL